MHNVDSVIPIMLSIDNHTITMWFIKDLGFRMAVGLISGERRLHICYFIVTLRNFELDHKYHKKLHAFSDQIERILVAIVLILSGRKNLFRS